MASLKEVVSFLDTELELSKFSADSSNNGLQFEGSHEVKTAVFGVDACAELFSAAADADADFIFVHHGISWGGSLKQIRGVEAQRVTMLASNSMSLYAVHLPLDAHPKIGHNAKLASILDLRDIRPFAEYCGVPIGFYGVLPKKLTAADIASKLDRKLPSEGGEYDIIGDSEWKNSVVGVVSGGGAWPSLFNETKALGIECLVTGCAEHESYHPAIESATTVVSMGHYRTETVGVLEVMELIGSKFKLKTKFIDIPTYL